MVQESGIRATGISKSFGHRAILSGVSLEVNAHQSLGLTGRNGSGKSTMMKILAGVLSPTKGDIALWHRGKAVPREEAFRILGFVAPYLQLYDEFSGYENLVFGARIRGTDASRARLDALLDRVNLLPRRNDLLRTYSSGMKQRLKFAFALLHEPPMLFLDEPTSNLDRDGIAIVHDLVREQKERGIVVIATNDQEDLRYCDALVSVEHPGPSGEGTSAR